MKNLKTTGIIHSVKKNQLDFLKETFAFLTEDGWVIPQWVLFIESNVKG